MTVRLFEPDDAASWDAYVRRSPSASCYHLTKWKTIIEQNFNQPAWYLLSERKAGEINGVLPVVQLKSPFFGNFIVSLPYFNYGGICADNPDIEEGLLREAIRIAEEKRVASIEFRHCKPVGFGLPVKMEKVSMRLELAENTDLLWKSFSSKLRSQVQRPLREGMSARFGGEEMLADFYAVFAENMRDLGTPVYSENFFRAILRSFPAETRICTVYTGECKPVASGFVLGFKDGLEVPWASSLRSHNRYSPNMLLYWSLLRFAVDNGYRFFDFGRSTPGEGTYRFKEQWGGRPFQLYWHYWLRDGGPMPELNPRNPKFRFAITVWKKLPVPVTKLIGPAIVRNLP